MSSRNCHGCSWHCCHFLAVMSSLSCPGTPSRLTCPGPPVLVALSQMSYANWPAMVAPSLVLSSCSVLAALSCPGYCVPAVLSQLSCANCPTPAILSAALLTLLSWHCCHILDCPLCCVRVHLSRLSCQDALPRLTYPGCPVSVVLSQMPYPDSPATAVPSPLLSCPCWHVLVSLSFVSFPGCTILTVFSGEDTQMTIKNPFPET